MKSCPSCHRIYDDEVSFCLEDGTHLSSSNTAEKTIVAPPPTIFSPNLARPAPAVKTKKFNSLTIILIVITVAALGLAAYQTFKTPQQILQTPPPSLPPTPTSTTNSPTNVRPAVPPRTSTGAATPSPTHRPIQSSPSDTSDWYVIIGTFSLSDRSIAETRASWARSEGFSVRVVETNDYPNFTPNFLAVVIGPLTKADAQVKGDMVRSKLAIIPTIKTGS